MVMKKSGENMLTTNFEEVIAVSNTVEPSLLPDSQVVPVAQPQLQARVNTICGCWLQAKNLKIIHLA
jgi:hypothetical protein